jgi:hypothetical protein
MKTLVFKNHKIVKYNIKIEKYYIFIKTKNFETYVSKPKQNYHNY